MAKELQEPTDFTVLGVPGPEGLVRPGARDGGLSPPGKQRDSNTGNAIRRDRARPIEQHGRVPGLFIRKNYDSTGRRVAFQTACLPPSNLNY